MQLDMPSFLDSHGRPALSCTEIVKEWVRGRRRERGRNWEERLRSGCKNKQTKDEWLDDSGRNSVVSPGVTSWSAWV